VHKTRWLSALVFILFAQCSIAQQVELHGRVIDPDGNALPGATITLIRQKTVTARTTSGPDGHFRIPAPSPEDFEIKADAEGFTAVTLAISVRPTGNPAIELRMNQVSPQVESITVTADVNQSDLLSPDPAERVFVRQDLLDANPGRPGAPVSIPGYPIETASSGIKAPQYFAPGVAGDHGEPIAQYISVGSYLVPNNLSANAHGNGYADPNIFIPEVLESVQVDGGAFNVREGNHSVNLAATYALRSRLDPFVTVTGDYRDIDAVVGVSPTAESFLTFAGSYGNGFLDRLEHRQQYKFNGQRIVHIGDHRVTLFGIGYYGSSYVPGLVPIFGPNSGDVNIVNTGDTIDPRQKDQTHTALVAVSDSWDLSASQQLQLSGFFRTYNLALYSDFGQGLIRQSEFRTVSGASADYTNKIAEYFSLLGGFDYQREVPRRDDLDHYLFPNPANGTSYGPFMPVAANNVTISPLTPYVAAQGSLSRYIRYYLGWRRDEIDFENQDLIRAANSFHKWVGVNSPKATLSFLPKDSWCVPLISFSFGQAFFTEDPRIGSGSAAVSLVSRSHSYQLVASKTVHKFDLRLTLGHVTNSAELAKIDADTGLQINQGPSRLRFATLAVRRNFRLGSFLVTFSKADARDLDAGEPTPEAPRTIADFLGTIEKLPLHLQARGEFEYVAAKPLGTGCLPVLTNECSGVPVKEFRGALVRPFDHGRFDVGINFLIASGYTGQTTENFTPSDIQEVVGVRIPSYASLTFTYRFGQTTH